MPMSHVATQRRASCRPFTLLDATILVAFTGIGLASIRWIAEDPFPNLLRSRSLAQAAERLAFWYFDGVPVLAAWTLGVLLLRLRRPRPEIRRIAHQPGFVACLAVFVCLIMEGVTIATLTLSNTVVPSWELLFVSGIGWAVGASWVCLLVSRRWRAERGWIDGVGRCLGLLWLVLPPLGLIGLQLD